MTVPVYTDSLFRQQFPEFANTQANPSAQISMYWTMGTSFISTYNAGAGYTDAQAQLANDLMAAHLTKLSCIIASGTTSGIVVGAAEGSVNVTLMPPPVKSAFGYWLGSTPYGQQLRALLDAIAGIGFYVGGLPERSGFRKIGGVF
jgi:hypothetical protein